MEFTLSGYQLKTIVEIENIEIMLKNYNCKLSKIIVQNRIQ